MVEKTNAFEPELEFSTRAQVDAYMANFSEGFWTATTEFEEFPDDTCLVSADGKLLIVPPGKNRLRSKAAVFPDVNAFREFRAGDNVVKSPLEIGFKEFLNIPQKIPTLASKFNASIGLNIEPTDLRKIDRWVAATRNKALSDLFLDPAVMRGLCVVAGEAVRQRVISQLDWVVRKVEHSQSSKIFYPADLIAADGRICSISFPLAKQIIDPDIFPKSTIVSSFVEYRIGHLHDPP